MRVVMSVYFIDDANESHGHPFLLIDFLFYFLFKKKGDKDKNNL